MLSTFTSSNGLFFFCLVIVSFYTLSLNYNPTYKQLDPVEVIPTSILKESLIDNLKLRIKPLLQQGCLLLNYESTGDFIGTITINNIIGQRLNQTNKCFLSGKQSFLIDVSRLDKGDYIIAISDGIHQQARKIQLDPLILNP